MKKSLFYLTACALTFANPTFGQGFYQFGTDFGESSPLKWKFNFNTIYDDNVGAGIAVGQKDGSLAFNPTIGSSLTHKTPQTTIDVFGHIGMIYYLDAPAGIDDVYSQSRASFSLIHRFDERLRYATTNFISYELEPDYAYGYATTRNGGETLFYETDHSLGYRINERLGVFSGFRVKQASYEDSNNDRLSGQLYNQLRYQYLPQTILTFDYRYEMVDASGLANNSTNQYTLAGVEHMFSQNLTGVIRAGAQFRDLENRGKSTNPYIEFNMIARPNSELSFRSFLRYGVEDTDTVQFLVRGGDLLPAEYSDRRSLRFGVAGDYVINPSFTLVGGLDYIPTRYNEGRYFDNNMVSPDVEEDLINVYVGLNYRITDSILARFSYNYSHSSSDFPIRDYDRNRLTFGVSAEF